MIQAPKLIFLPISPWIVLAAGVVSVVLPALYFLAEFEAMSQQSAGPGFLQFRTLNNVAMLVIECAGLAVLLGTFMSRSHLFFSTFIAALSIGCGLVTIGVSFLYFLGVCLR